MVRDVKEELLQKPLYIYDLPEELLSNLFLKDDTSAPDPQLQQDTESGTAASSDVPATNCTLCGFMGRNVDEQRTHVRSDMHKLNMKRKIRGQRILNEAEFERTLADIDERESISGSESSNSSENEEGESEQAVKKRKGVNPISNKNDDEDAEEVVKKDVHKTPLLWFKSSLLPATVSLGAYRAILPEDSSGSISFILDNQIKPGAAAPGTTPPHFFLCMIGGGHFAAMVVSLMPIASEKSGEGTHSILASKTFHRYTTRRKQGGAQSANDAAKGKANSAGSSLRRYNEAELTKDIRELLASWKTEWIDTAELLFIRAAGTTNRRTLFHYENAVLKAKDSRMRGFPFSTRRATNSELLRSFIELTRFKVSRISESSLLAESTATESDSSKQKTFTSTSGPRTLKPTKAEQELLDHTSILTSLIRRSKVPPLLTYLSANSLTPDFAFYPSVQHFHAPTLLHLAASLNSPTIVTALLSKAGANPAVTTGDEKTPFEVAGDRATRDAFRLARSELGESKWDWTAAKVTSPLTQEEVTSRHEAELRNKRIKEEKEAQRRKREAERLRKEEEEREKRATRNAPLGNKGVMLGAGVGRGQRLQTGDDLGREREAVGLSPEARMRLERERRARAAEARIRGMTSGGATGGGAS